MMSNEEKQNSVNKLYVFGLAIVISLGGMIYGILRFSNL